MLAPSHTSTKIAPVEICSLLPLPRRMAALGLDTDTVARFDPDTFGSLRSVCATCEHHERCQWDLRQDCANPVWQEYCPNRATLRALGRLPWLAGVVSY
jgi:hypothetical protein